MDRDPWTAGSLQRTRSRLLALCLAALATTCFVAAHLLGPPPFLLAPPQFFNPSSPVPSSNSAVATNQSPVTTTTTTAPQPSLPARAVRFPRTRRRLPHCVIIGARKCGTRALLEFLNLHPGIQKAPDEVHFFDDDSKYALGLEWYRRHMPYSFPDQLTVEKSPAYFVTEAAPGRVWAMNATIRLLLIVRDPVIRLVSDYAQLAANRQQRDKRVAPFEEVVLNVDGTVNTEYRPVRTSMYAVYFRRWLSHFQRQQIHVIDGDRLVKQPFEEMRKVETFLGLTHRIPKDAFYFNRTKGFFCVRNDTVDKCLNESKGRKHPDVPGPVVSKLRQFYAPFNREFYQMVGKDFEWPEE
uniref:Heparan sulfate glucosamine 3-O-sulfotransferase 5 n=1 Tax=Ornithodoros turicata TaxID=34597 RepID=A0A2R5LA52_9ACAR